MKETIHCITVSRPSTTFGVLLSDGRPINNKDIKLIKLKEYSKKLRKQYRALVTWRCDNRTEYLGSHVTRLDRRSIRGGLSWNLQYSKMLFIQSIMHVTRYWIHRYEPIY